ncbi:helix-turn-helix domain-containing protein [Actinomadura sp. BRA 177]|uniref:winged helix-turn-helix transcriptional regulator n=1 Tax=Actinomadura sp. BRA 177 TaxID=2745202 RepID=UPI0015959E50|nr:helix-turn-helix domain-containing protein [Actinomadura sp. BRA 177]NVI89182.1 helix-turn-helix transcriptional regulator [Actinomadura sp. BRA 177]
MGASYYQFCPVAKAMELLDERWTLLIVRELLSGSEHFNEVRRGVPRMSPTLLSKRLNQLVRAGVAEKKDDRYVLTPAGKELRPVVDALAVWGVRWIGELGDQDLDPKLLLWDMRRNITLDAIPDTRTVILFVFPDVQPRNRHWWLVMNAGAADVCDTDPGYEVSVTVTADLRHMVRIWRGDTPWQDALRSGAIDIQGPEPLRRTLPTWFALSPFATIPRPTVHDAGGALQAR